ncbi:uncharacterized protein LOC125235512 [Leguminivora glycinivorella]|uniref:uncharacterized protein LOC125235512 n=1 Tax=Leguminivora glycinivorella TaxID=1035111 RepID=UPI00200C5B57|nr:uncharacterized protein LOC125235512 [Leguminivora glycinivorella]
MLDKNAMMRKMRCCCIPVDKATFIYGIFSSVLSAICILAFSTFHMWFGAVSDEKEFAEWLRDPESVPKELKNEKHLNEYMWIMIIVFLWSLWSVVSFIFSVFLCYGTHKRRPAFVKAYLVYGVVVTTLMLAVACFYIWRGDVVNTLIQLVFCGLYSLVLLMVKRTHEMIQAEQTCESTQILTSKPSMIA